MKKILNVLLVTCLCFGMVVGCGSREKSEDSKEKEESRESVNKEQESKEIVLNGYSFDIPAEWSEGDSTDNVLYFYPETGMLMIQFSAIENADILDEDVQAEYTQGLSESYEDFELIEESIVQITGQEAYRQVISLTNEGTAFESTMVTFNCPGGWMTFALFEVVGAEESYSQEFTAILDSIKSENGAASEGMTDGETADEVLDQIQVEAVQTLDGLMCLFITNNSQTIVDELDVQINYKDESGSTIDMDDDGFDKVLPGSTVVSRMETPESFSDYEIQAGVELGTNPSYENHANDIEINSNQGDRCIIVEITNNSGVNIDEVEYIAVLYQGDQIVTVEYPEDIMDVQSGDTVTEKIETYDEEYDHFEIYLNQAHTFGF